MKSVKSVSIEPEYTQLLGEYDKAQSIYDDAKKQEAKAKRALKSANKDASKSEEQVLKLQLNQAKHTRKAQKAAVGILELAVKQWIKVHFTEGSDTATETPKKRGPKPKIKAEATEKAPKKRGRQSKKGGTAVEKLVEGVTDTPIEVVSAKKRGRKPKTVETITETVTGTITGTIPETTVDATTSKKRGRQSKTVEVAENTEPIAPKKRGRQPKVVATMIAETAEPAAPKKQGKVKELPRLEAEVEEGVSGVSARAMEATATRGMGKSALEPKRPRQTSEAVVTKKSSLLAAANAAVSGGDDFRILEGIGPKVTALLHENGIKTFENLANSSYDDLKALMLRQRQYLANPTNWARQAALAAAGQMEALAALKAALKSGVEKRKISV